MIIRTNSRDVPPSWSDCCGSYGFTEWRVWINGELIIDEFDTGGSCFDDEAHAVESARWMVSNPEPVGVVSWG